MADDVDIARKRLTRNIENLLRAGHGNVESYLGSFLASIDDTQVLREIAEPISNGELDFASWEAQLWSEGSQLPDDETDRARMCLAILRHYRAADAIFNIGSGVAPGLTDGDAIIQAHVREFLPPVVQWLDEQLDLRDSQVTPEDIIEEKVGYIETDVARRYPDVYGKLQQAMKVLRTGVGETDWSTAGHHCREAVQDFAEAVYAQHYSKAKESPLPIEKTINKIRSVLDERRGQEKKPSLQKLLEAVLPFWQEVTDYVERAEHRGHQATPITREDARRCVLYTFLVIAELDRLLQS